MFIVGVHRRGEAALQDGPEHGVIARAVGGEGPAQGHRQVVIGPIEPLTGLRPHRGVEARGHNGVGQPGQDLQVLLVLTLEALLGRRRAGRIRIVHLTGELAATANHPVHDGVDVQGPGVGAGAVELEEPPFGRGRGVDVLNPQLAQVGQPQQ